MVVKIFWEENCMKCGNAKSIGKQLTDMGESVVFCNVKDDAGINQAIYHDILSTPSIVVTNQDNIEIAAWQKTIPTIDEIVNKIKETRKV